jgi:hypothetical protein
MLWTKTSQAGLLLKRNTRTNRVINCVKEHDNKAESGISEERLELLAITSPMCPKTPICIGRHIIRCYY